VARQAQLKGSTQPRLWTQPLRPLTRKTTLGYDVADFAEAIGEPFLPWQRWLAIHALEQLPGGAPRFRVIVMLVARQNGKSSFMRTLCLDRLYIDGAKLVLGVAQDVSLAREQWQMALDTIEDSPLLAAELAKVRRVNGDEWFRVAGQEIRDDDQDEWFKLSAGGRYKIAAPNRKAGRGLSIDLLSIDEIREWRTWDAWSNLSKTVMARPRAQTWATSNAGDDGSIVLNQLRDAALSGRDPSIGLFEWSGEDGCDLDNPKAWCQANPGLGYTISEQAIRTALSTDPPDVFRTEVLCQKVDNLDSAIDPAAWRACADPAGSLQNQRGRLTACLDVAPDGAHVTLALAGRTPDGRTRIEIAAAWASTSEARTELAALLDRFRPVALAWYPSGPAAALAPLIRQRPGQIELKGTGVGEACQGLADLVRDRRVTHNADPLLQAHITSARKLTTGDGWRFTRTSGHVDAAYAAAGAVYATLTVPQPQRARITSL
jgi:phage terminase large subunit-like protein